MEIQSYMGRDHWFVSNVGAELLFFAATFYLSSTTVPSVAICKHAAACVLRPQSGDLRLRCSGSADVAVVTRIADDVGPELAGALQAEHPARAGPDCARAGVGAERTCWNVSDRCLCCMSCTRVMPTCDQHVSTVMAEWKSSTT